MQPPIRLGLSDGDTSTTTTTKSWAWLEKKDVDVGENPVSAIGAFPVWEVM